jgi:hypothetical protein
MTLTLADILTVVTIGVMISGAVFGAFTYFDKRKNTKTVEKGTEGDYTNDMSASVAIVYKQAKEALQDKASAEIAHKVEMKALREELGIKFEAQQVENAKLRDEVAALRKEIAAIAYEIRLVAQLGDDPKVETVTIKRIASAIK